MEQPDGAITLTVGPGPAAADVTGTTGAAVQLAIDAVAQRGGGTVRLLPGEYTLMDSIRLRRRVTLMGEREKVLLKRGPLAWSRLAVDADTGEDEITPEDASPFGPGMGVCTWDQQLGWAMPGAPVSIAAVQGGVLRLRDHVTADRYAVRNGRVVNYFPMILLDQADDASVEGLTVDAQVDDPDGVLAGLEIAAVAARWSRRVAFRRLKVTHGRSDGIGFGKASHYSTIEDCESAENLHLGIHPGSHSRYGAFRRNDVHHNGRDGLYVCWGVRHSVFEENHIHHNARSGFSIGHKDTDNLIAGNHIHDNGLYGMLFRAKTEPNGPHRNVVRGNVIENNGTRCRPDEAPAAFRRVTRDDFLGCGVRVQSVTHDLVFENNVIRETRSGEAAAQRHAFVLDPGVSRVTIRNNEISGHPEDPIVDRSGAGDHVIERNAGIGERARQ